MSHPAPEELSKKARSLLSGLSREGEKAHARKSPIVAFKCSTAQTAFDTPWPGSRRRPEPFDSASEEAFLSAPLRAAWKWPAATGAAHPPHRGSTHRTGAAHPPAHPRHRGSAPAEPRSHPLPRMQQFWKTSLERVLLKLTWGGGRTACGFPRPQPSFGRAAARPPQTRPRRTQPRAEPLPPCSDLAGAGKLVPWPQPGLPGERMLPTRGRQAHRTIPRHFPLIFPSRTGDSG